MDECEFDLEQTTACLRGTRHGEAAAAAILKGDRDAALQRMLKLAPRLEDGEAEAYVDAMIALTAPQPGEAATGAAAEIEAAISWRYGDNFMEYVREGCPNLAVVALVQRDRCGRADAETLVAHWRTKTGARDVDLVEIPKSEVKAIRDLDKDEGEPYVMRWRDVVWTGVVYQTGRAKQAEVYLPNNRGLKPLKDVEQVWCIVPRGTGSKARRAGGRRA